MPSTKAAAAANNIGLVEALHLKLGNVQEGDFAAQLARMFDAAGNHNFALRYWANALASDKEGKHPQWLEGKKLSTARQAARLRNEERRPVVRANFEQAQVVRLRLKPEQMTQQEVQ